uniref:Uncharacterized protein n=1 Tax=viral metagenome TaxID=1070528 RepID=A0A6C0K504_9ZZZZ
MAKGNRISACILLGICIILLILSLYFRVDGFVDETKKDVPDTCKKAGWTYSKGILQVVKDFVTPYSDQLAKKTISDLTRYRQYTPADCKSLGGWYTTVQGLQLCYDVKDPTQPITEANVIGIYNMNCSGLNSISTSPPPECYINKQVAGTPNVEFTVTLANNPLKVPAGAVLLYTQEECNKLGGEFINAGIIKDKAKISARDWLAATFPFLSKLTELDVNNILSANGYDKGFCKDNKKDLIFNMVCAAGNTGLSKASDAAASALNSLSNAFS